GRGGATTEEAGRGTRPTGPIEEIVHQSAAGRQITGRGRAMTARRRRDMATSPTSKVLQHLRRTVQRQDGTGRTDGELLECFIEHREDVAFAALVRRHGRLVG